jgi:hypothetical protein
MSNDIFMELGPDGIYKITIIVTTSAEFKIRKNSSWEINYGSNSQGNGNIITGKRNGYNIIISTPGTYEITFDISTNIIQFTKI